MDIENLRKSKLTYNLYDDRIISKENALTSLWKTYNSTDDLKTKSVALSRIEAVNGSKIGFQVIDKAKNASFLLTKKDLERFSENYENKDDLEFC